MIQVNINCKSVGVIYCIFCTKYNRNIYVRQTGDTLYQRMLLFSKIRTGKIDDPVANHFYQIDHSTCGQFQGLENRSSAGVNPGFQVRGGCT
jgi:hypothetical protein